MFDYQDFAANPRKYQAFRTARVPGGIFTHNGERDIPAGAIVAVEYRLTARNQMFRRDEPVYAVTYNGETWGDLYASTLDQFTL